MANAESPRALVVWTIVAVTVATGVVWALYLVRQSLLLIYVSALLAVGFSPLVRLIETPRLLRFGTWRVPHWVAVLVVYLVILGGAAGVSLTVFPPLVRQAQELAKQLPAMLEQGQEYLLARGWLRARLTFAEFFRQTPGTTDAVGTIVAGLWGLLGGVVGVLTIVILTFYLLVESESLFEAFVRLFPRARRIQVRTVAHQITLKVSGWLSGQAILAGVIGLSSVLWLGLLGIPYFYVLALIAAIGELIPFIGPLFAALPGIAVALTVSWKLAVVVALFYLTQQQLESNLLVPKLMERQVGLSAAAVIVALLIGGSLLGVLGAVLSVPTAAILQVVFHELLAEEA